MESPELEGGEPEETVESSSSDNPAELSVADLKPIIVGMLEARPNSSCKRADVAKLVLKHLRRRVRPRDRREFSRRIGVAIGHLQNGGVVVKYRATNLRLRLADDYKEHFSRLQRRQQKVQPRHVTGPASGQFLFDLPEVSDQEKPGAARAAPNSDRFSLPDLPDDEESEKNGSTDRWEPDRASPRRSDPDSNDEQHEATYIPERERSSLALSVEQVIRDLCDCLRTKHGIEVRRQLHTLHLRLTGDAEALMALVDVRPSRRQMVVRVHLPFHPAATLPLLKLFCSESVSSILGVTPEPDPPQFVLRRAISFSADPDGELDQLVVEVLDEAAKALVLVNRTR